MGASGQTTVSAGAAPSTSNEVVQTVTGITGISAANSELEAWIQPKDTTDHSADEHCIEDLNVKAYNIADNTGFDIRLRCENGPLYGDWNVAWAWDGA